MKTSEERAQAFIDDVEKIHAVHGMRSVASDSVRADAVRKATIQAERFESLDTSQRMGRLRWIQRGNRYFADGRGGTYRVLPGENGCWSLGVRVGDMPWTELGGDFVSSAAAKRDAQKRDAQS